MSDQRPVFARRIMGIETEYGLTTSAGSKERTLSPDEVARVLFRPIVQEHSSSSNIPCDSGISGPSYSSIASRILFQPGFRSGVSTFTTTLPDWPVDE